MQNNTEHPWGELCQRLMYRANISTPFMEEIGFHLDSLSPMHAEGSILPNEKVCNPRGILHGGIIYTIMDHTAGFAVCTGGCGCVTVNSSVNYLRTIPPHQKLRCTGEVVKQGKTLCVAEAHVWDEADRELARGTFTFCVMENLWDTLDRWPLPPAEPRK